MGKLWIEINILIQQLRHDYFWKEYMLVLSGFSDFAKNTHQFLWNLQYNTYFPYLPVFFRVFVRDFLGIVLWQGFLLATSVRPVCHYCFFHVYYFNVVHMYYIIHDDDFNSQYNSKVNLIFTAKIRLQPIKAPYMWCKYDTKWSEKGIRYDLRKISDETCHFKKYVIMIYQVYIMNRFDLPVITIYD